MSSIFSHHQFMSDLEASENSPENSPGESPCSAVSADAKIASTWSAKRSKRALDKRVVSVAMKEAEGLRLKGDLMSSPPSDSWAWRKYGQKPIKGSPYPRGYYRCSSSKGCPARKQVERSRVDSKMLVVTYYSQHNHPWPASRNNHRTTAARTPETPVSKEEEEIEVEEEEEEEEQEEEEESNPAVNLSNNEQNQSPHQIVLPDSRFSSLGDAPLIQASEFGWLSDFDCASSYCPILESPILTEDVEIFAMREEDEPLFADLGELPECSAVFRRGMALNGG